MVDFMTNVIADGGAILDVEAVRAAWELLFAAVDVPAEDASLLVDVHIDAELRGESSHGMHLLPVQLRKILAGAIRARPKVTVLSDHAAIALFDAHHSVGQVVAARAMRLAIERARKFGVGIVGVRSASSFTSAKYYPLLAVAEGCVGITYANSRPMMPPQGGAAAVIGNNPVAIAAPAGAEYPFVLDMACAAAKEKIFQAAAEGRKIPENWALDVDGNPTTDPHAALASQVMLPFGGHKAVGLAMAHELLTSVLFGGELFTGAGTGFRPYDNPMRVTQYFQAIDVAAFTSLESFRSRMDAMIAALRHSRRRPNVDRIFVPGERGFLEREKRLAEGIPASPVALQSMRELADELGVALPQLERA